MEALERVVVCVGAGEKIFIGGRSRAAGAARAVSGSCGAVVMHPARSTVPARRRRSGPVLRPFSMLFLIPLAVRLCMSGCVMTRLSV